MHCSVRYFLNKNLDSHTTHLLHPCTLVQIIILTTDDLCILKSWIWNNRIKSDVNILINETVNCQLWSQTCELWVEIVGLFMPYAYTIYQTFLATISFVSAPHSLETSHKIMFINYILFKNWHQFGKQENFVFNQIKLGLVRVNTHCYTNTSKMTNYFNLRNHNIQLKFTETRTNNVGIGNQTLVTHLSIEGHNHCSTMPATYYTGARDNNI